jgi:asparagine synthase (glutamine-hydrolysing)
MSKLDIIEKLLLQEFETVPFHNLFMLNNKNIVASDLGGTCSDKVLHFKKVLAEHGILSRLHSAFINNIECHRMLTVELNNQKYFIDVGSGWASTKLFPAFEAIEYSVYGMTFKTKFADSNLLLFHKTNDEFKLMATIPLQSKNEKDIELDIITRFNDTSIYPFQSSLRFSKVIDDKFYFIKGNKLRIYNANYISERILTKKETKSLIKETFRFDLGNMKYEV